MTIRILVVATLCVIGTIAGALVTSALRTPTRTVVEPIELREESEEKQLEREDGAGKRSNKPRRDRGRDDGSGMVEEQAPVGDDGDGGAPPAPAPVPVPAGDDDADGADDDEGGESEGDDD